MNKTLYASIRAAGGGVIPDAFTRQLGIEPSHGWQKGEPYVDILGILRRRYNGLWIYEAKDVSSDSPCEHVQQVIRLARGCLERCRNECHGDVNIDVCLWVEAAETSFTIGRKTFEDILDEGMDGLNITFVGIDDSSLMTGSTSSLIAGVKAYFRMAMASVGGEISSIIRRGRLSYNSNKNLALFYQKVLMQKEKILEVRQDCVSVDLEWNVPHGALYLGRDLLRLLCDLKCSFVRFTFRNVPD